MTTWPELYAAIIDQPADDGLRLIAADFLEENGEPERAEIIRVQCELAKLSTKPRKFEVSRETWAMWRGEASTAVVQKPGEASIQVGERINVIFWQAIGKPSKRLRQHYDQLLVTYAKRSGLRGGIVETRLELKMDEFSVPWAGERLQQRESALLAAHAQTWLRMPEAVRKVIGEQCETCKGSGRFYPEPHPTGAFQKPIFTRCEPCHGLGRTNIFRRGFPAVVSLTCWELMGGECNKCNGTGLGEDRLPYLKCGKCWVDKDNFGHIPGLARAIGQALPLVEEVRLIWKEPHNTGGLYWWNIVVGDNPWPNQIPAELFYLLPTTNPSHDEGESFPSHAAAQLALWHAGAKWCRDQAAVLVG
jgi:uncharacterized protein (TIGR02996 family)